MLTQETNPTLLQTRQHFEVLDGLRGVAAVAVVIFHFMELIKPDYHDNFIAHAYFAVDFFFCLSGFVIAYAYDQRIRQMGISTFLKLRLIRLHPLVVIGSVIGLLAFVFDPFSTLYQKYADRIIPMFITSCLMIPYPLVKERYFNLFHLNPPTWSLFWEYIANLIYVLFLVKINHKILWLLTIAAAVALAFEAHRSNFLGVGFGGDNVMGGGYRMLYSFLAGILVYRSQWIIPSKLGLVSLSILLLLSFLIPFSKHTSRLVDPLVLIFYLPFLVALGAGATHHLVYQKICKFLGDISYPLYMTHYPFIWLVLSYMEVKKPSVQEMVVVMIAGVILLILFAYAVMVLLDIPLRKYFTHRLKRGWTKS
ncbi:acyltransferase [Siphonobacter sp. SORGH_AS_0500]|uniref:acyltransferase family protein n=1 Tax=Siphonobacter sp. SORGH_AS_0500 TaxID=1864824 RepID=UPI000CBA8F09|nr:acyltransferase [Siphonobacter sp. SORGH_AS_0500]PKK35577.1 acyltransferase [Siphonobacter sp. SORGH_AS_0500]